MSKTPRRVFFREMGFHLSLNSQSQMRVGRTSIFGEQTAEAGQPAPCFCMDLDVRGREEAKNMLLGAGTP